MAKRKDKIKPDNVKPYREIADKAGVSVAYTQKKCLEVHLKIWDAIRPSAPSAVEAINAMAEFFNVEPEYMLRELLSAGGEPLKQDILRELMK